MNKTWWVALAVAGPAMASAQATFGSATAGERKVAMCIGCHGIPGYQAGYPLVHKVPKIAGQGAGYIVAALNAYRKGDRRHPTMRGAAQSLTDQDIADIASFYAAQGRAAGAVGSPGTELEFAL